MNKFIMICLSFLICKANAQSCEAPESPCHKFMKSLTCEQKACVLKQRKVIVKKVEVIKEKIVPVIQEKVIEKVIVKTSPRKKNKISLLAEYGPNGLTRENQYEVHQDYNPYLGVGYSRLLGSSSISLELNAFANKSGGIGLGYEF
jgi:hypothetical protein